jgi:hypothetical protein
MSKLTTFRFGVLVCIIVLGWCVLSFQQTPIGAQTNPGANPDNLPFANSVTQRQEMIANLKEINAEIKAANSLLRSGKLRVVVSVERRP